MTDQIETAKIEDALEALLVAARRHAVENPREGSARSFQELNADFAARAPRSEAHRRADELIDDPVAVALRRAIRDLGRRLFEIGGTGLMGNTLEAIASRHPEDADLLEDIADRQFNGIGNWAS
jgi:hypothetical protein